jgi:hypothetical protein
MLFHRAKVQYVAAEKAGLAYMGAMLQLIGGEHAHQLRAVLEQPSHPDAAAALSAVVADEAGEEEQAANDVHKQAAVCQNLRICMAVQHIQICLWRDTGVPACHDKCHDRGFWTGYHLKVCSHGHWQVTGFS